MPGGKKYKAAIIGCGRIASRFAQDQKRQGVVTHAQAYRKNPDTELVAAADLNPERLMDFKRTWGLPDVFSDYREMIEKRALDILSICTPTQTHFEIAKYAIEHGVKAIFCEKPMVATLKEADELEALVRSSRVVFAVNHSRRWDEMEIKIQKFIAEGKLGRIQSVDAYYTAGIANSGSHLIDLLRMLTGQEVETVWGLRRIDEDADPTLDGVLGFSGGFFAFLHGLDVKSYLRFEVDIYGTDGRILVRDSGFGSAYWQAGPHPEFSGYQALISQETSFGQGYQNVLPNALNNIVNALEGKETVLSTVSDGKKTLEVMAALLESIRNGGCKYACHDPAYAFPLKNREAGLFGREFAHEK